MTSPAIETDGLAKAYGRTAALASLSMNVERGEVFGFLGPNGAGKTTAVKLLLGLARPTGGRALVLGAPLGDRATRARIGYLPELFRYQPWLRAREVLALHCDLAGSPPAVRSRDIAQTLETVGLTRRANDLVGTFSKGMQQRLGLAVALLGGPELVVLDEPTSALDPVGRSEVRSIVRAIADRGGTVFLNSHLLTEVERVCDRVAIVDQGHVVATGRPSDLATDAGVRIVVDGLDRPAELASKFGAVTVDGAGMRVLCSPSAVPDLVAALVAAGGRVAAVEPLRRTLEDRFLELVSGSGG
jgi:ABC-2 type transport system ATP-binding protein